MEMKRRGGNGREEGQGNDGGGCLIKVTDPCCLLKD